MHVWYNCALKNQLLEYRVPFHVLKRSFSFVNHCGWNLYCLAWGWCSETFLCNWLEIEILTLFFKLIYSVLKLTWKCFSQSDNIGERSPWFLQLLCDSPTLLDSFTGLWVRSGPDTPTGLSFTQAWHHGNCVISMYWMKMRKWILKILSLMAVTWILSLNLVLKTTF